MHSGCLCPQGFARDYRGNCVPEDVCYSMMCPENEYWQICYDDNGSYHSENSCETGYGSWQQSGCVEGCRCGGDSWRHPDGHCVSGLECPVLPSCPGENEIYTDRAGGCCEPNCDGWACHYEHCYEGCACAPGFIRMNGECVEEGLCFNQECGANAHFSDCGQEDVTGCCNHAPDICYQRKNKDGKKIQESVSPGSKSPLSTVAWTTTAWTPSATTAPFPWTTGWTPAATAWTWPATTPSWTWPVTTGAPTTAAPSICKIGCFCDDGYVLKELWTGNKECVLEESCQDGDAFCDMKAPENTIFIEDQCMDRFECCHVEGSNGLCTNDWWGWGHSSDDPTVPTCWPYQNECVCPDTHAWSNGECVPKDYCSYAFEKCPANQKFVRDECVTNAVWDYCCSNEYYDDYYDTTDGNYCGYNKKSEFTGREPDGKNRNEEDCWNYTGCLCEDGFKWADYRNPITDRWEWLCVPDDRCEDAKICKGDEDYVECPMGTESMCVDNQVIWGVNHPSKVALDGAACLDPNCHCANGLVRDEDGKVGFKKFFSHDKVYWTEIFEILKVHH